MCINYALKKKSRDFLKLTMGTSLNEVIHLCLSTGKHWSSLGIDTYLKIDISLIGSVVISLR